MLFGRNDWSVGNGSARFPPDPGPFVVPPYGAMLTCPDDGAPVAGPKGCIFISFFFYTGMRGAVCVCVCAYVDVQYTEQYQYIVRLLNRSFFYKKDAKQRTESRYHPSMEGKVFRLTERPYAGPIRVLLVHAWSGRGPLRRT